jgi:hypothetical protein
VAAFVTCSTAGPAHAAIKVLSQNQDTIARIGAVKCEVKRVKGDKRFTALGKKGGSRLKVVIFPGSFDGFHSYEVLYGSDSTADVLWGAPGELFANFNKPDTGGPPGPELTVAGGVGFPSKRRVLHVGIPILYDSSFNWVSVAGQARCKY